MEMRKKGGWIVASMAAVLALCALRAQVQTRALAPAAVEDLFRARRGGVAGGVMDKTAMHPEPESAPTTAEDLSAVPAPPARTVVPEKMPRKIVRNAQLALEVSDFALARARALEIAARRRAEVQQDDTGDAGENKSGTLSFRVAPEGLDGLLRELEGLGRIASRSLSTENKTEEYVDLQSRLANLRKVEQRLTQLLAFKTTKLSDVLLAEKELERVGSDIESLQGKLKYIDALSARSEVTVSLSEPPAEANRAVGVARRVTNSIVRASNTFVATGLVLLDLTGFLLAVGLWAAPLAGILWLLWRRFGSAVA